jgi:hypothetical protein
VIANFDEPSDAFMILVWIENIAHVEALAETLPNPRAAKGFV